jgi:hypothetical protein
MGNRNYISIVPVFKANHDPIMWVLHNPADREILTRYLALDTEAPQFFWRVETSLSSGMARTVL